MDQHEPNEARPQGLELFFAMYAVGLVLGIQQTAEALYKHVQLQWTHPTLRFVLEVGLFVAILLLIVRFFWSTGNIRRALVRGRAKTTAHYLVVHLPILLVQGVLVLFVCFSFVDYLAGKVSAYAVIGWFLFATAWNTIWLVGLLGRTWIMPETFWIANNFVFGASTGVLLFIEQSYFSNTNVSLGLFVLASLVSSLLDLGRTQSPI